MGLVFWVLGLLVVGLGLWLARRATLVVLALLALVVVLVLVLRPQYERHVIAQAAEIAGDDPTCLFVGRFVQGDLPVTVPRQAGEPWVNIIDDVRDRFLNAEQAKPPHFGFYVVRGGADAPMAEIWAWSYRKTAFWRLDQTGYVFRLSTPSGDFVADCLAQYAG